jgi:dienelactone hydrolase
MGLNDWARSMADQVAGEGYIVIARDMLSGKAPGGGKTGDLRGRGTRFHAFGRRPRCIGRQQEGKGSRLGKAQIPAVRALEGKNGPQALTFGCRGDQLLPNHLDFKQSCAA